jgi:hypothetical protein
MNVACRGFAGAPFRHFLSRDELMMAVADSPDQVARMAEQALDLFIGGLVRKA